MIVTKLVTEAECRKYLLFYYLAISPLCNQSKSYDYLLLMDLRLNFDFFLHYIRLYAIIKLRIQYRIIDGYWIDRLMMIKGSLAGISCLYTIYLK